LQRRWRCQRGCFGRYEWIMFNFPKNTTPRWIIWTVDLLGVFFAFVGAYLIRFEFHPPSDEWARGVYFFPILLSIRAISFLIGKTYAGIIRFTSNQDGIRIFTVLTIGSVVLMGLNISHRFLSADLLYYVPISILVIEYIFLLFYQLVFRASVKYLYQLYVAPKENLRKKVIMVGVGELARTVKRAFDQSGNSGKTIVAWVDPDNKLNGNTLEGTQIISQEKAFAIIQQTELDELILAFQQEDKALRKKWMGIAADAGLKVYDVPPLQNWINGQWNIGQLKDVPIEELLDRNVIEMDDAAVKQDIAGKVVLVTGAAGSIGSEIVKQILSYRPSKVVALDQAETPLFELENEVASSALECVIGDVRQKDRLRKVFDHFRPQVVYHAAAYKHVPLMENNPSEAIHTNVLGTKYLADLSTEFGVQKFVMVSTDKAVNPTNVMGATKRAAEIYVQSLSKTTQTEFITTRFGNVLGSNGSVLKIFKKQIEQGGPVTVTDPEITRYFMTIPEAVSLVLQAGSMGKGGEIFVFDMGEKVKIADLAKKMIRLSGYKLGVDMEVVYTGLRPGEKLYEEVLSDAETTLPTRHPKILIAKVKENQFEEVQQWMGPVEILWTAQQNDELVVHLKKLIPEYKSNNSEFEKLD
jgi:FlaA1/EpsC-like NDP-sugar epimerase